MNLSDCFYLGYISKVIGTEGRCSIHLDVDEPTDYENLESVLIQLKKDDQTPVPFFLKKVVKLKGQILEVALDLENQFQILIQDLKGKSVFLPLDSLKPLGEGKFYFHEIIGYQVEDESKGNIGEISDVYEMPSDPVMAIQLKGKEILIPIRQEIIIKVDKKEKIIYVNAPEGLVDLYLN